MEILILFSAITLFSGYIVGRIGHIAGGHLKTPHHWIYGFVLIIIGYIYQYNSWGILILSFGAGFFISDLRDFLNLKFYGIDENTSKRFWDVD
ncbi:hypothetical protein KKC00_00030 [Patescibacteria group bacterium]|nr:hypothetical protein [Patescibacteria group bacterium]